MHIPGSYEEEDTCTYLAGFAVATCEAKCEQTAALAPVDLRAHVSKET
jgi:hypothetical protein